MDEQYGLPSNGVYGGVRALFGAPYSQEIDWINQVMLSVGIDVQEDRVVQGASSCSVSP